MLTTVDNPFSPVTQWDDWLKFDDDMGYNTPGMLARIAIVGESLSENDQDQAIEDAIDEIVRENVLGLYRKVPVPA